jgi:hypothetical protein
VAYYDMPTVRAIVRDAKRDNYAFASLVSGIVRSAPFQQRMKSAESEPGSTTTARSNVAPGGPGL